MDDILQDSIQLLKIWSSSIQESFVQVLFAINAVVSGHPVDIQLLLKNTFELL